MRTDIYVGASRVDLCSYLRKALEHRAQQLSLIEEQHRKDTCPFQTDELQFPKEGIADHIV